MNKLEIEPHIVRSFGKEYMTSTDRVEDIAKRHHVSRHTIYKYAKLHGWVRPTHVYPGNGVEAKVIPFSDLYRAYYVEVLSMKEIAQRFGCHERVVKRSMKRHELKRMPKSERYKKNKQKGGVGLVYELRHGSQRFLLFPRLLTLHALADGSLKNVTTMSEDAMISLLNAYSWVAR